MPTVDEALQILEEEGVNEEVLHYVERAARFHGHICPGLAVGCVASMIVLQRFPPSADEELVAVVENDSCSVDAIQVLTGCTFGKGNLFHYDYGKSVYTFYSRGSSKAIRLAMKDVYS
ncbi:MAG: formylmethanofuran dehydrogenase subunit E family protein, partial [Thermoplasmata archaeon]|nr:formylmethanofuran dehydrogenase subunit E family protein [Thermoplasmata archaeon]